MSDLEKALQERDLLFDLLSEVKCADWDHRVALDPEGDECDHADKYAGYLPCSNELHARIFAAITQMQQQGAAAISPVGTEALRQGIKAIESWLRNVLGCYAEYKAMPCQSTQQRLEEAVERATKCLHKEKTNAS
jgi:hypothetical protein